MDYTNLTPKYVTASTESELEDKLYALGEVTGKMPHLITIYPRGSKIIAWVMLDKREVSTVPQQEAHKEISKKTTKKKTTKKKVTKKVN